MIAAEIIALIGAVLVDRVLHPSREEAQKLTNAELPSSKASLRLGAFYGTCLSCLSLQYNTDDS